MSPGDVARIREWVQRYGGGYLGFCAGAFLGGSKFLGLIEIDFVANLTKCGELKGEVLCSVGEESITMNYHNGPVWDWKLPKNVLAIATAQDVSNSLSKVRSKMRCKPVIVKQGHIVLCGPHPEHTDGLEDYTWALIMQCVEE